MRLFWCSSCRDMDRYITKHNDGVSFFMTKRVVADSWDKWNDGNRDWRAGFHITMPVASADPADARELASWLLQVADYIEERNK